MLKFRRIPQYSVNLYQDAFLKIINNFESINYPISCSYRSVFYLNPTCMFIWVFWSHYLFVMCLFSNNSYIILYQLFIHFSKTPTISHWVYICPLLGLAHFIVAYFDNYWYVAIGCVLQGSTFGVINSQSPAVMYEAAGLKRYPQGMALVNLMYGFGNLFSNVIGGKYQHALYVNV